MRRRLVLSCLVSLMSLLVACAPSDGDLTGEVFIVTKGGTNVKLGLVGVSAIPAESTNSHIDRKRQEAEAELATLRPETEKQDVALQAAKAESERLFKIHLSDIMDRRKTVAYEKASEDAMAKAQQYDALAARAAYYKSGDFYLAGLPAGIATSKTDADGKFTLRIPRGGKFAVAARGSRELGKQTEAYYWLVWVSLNGQASKHLMLSNDNVMGRGASDSALN